MSREKCNKREIIFYPPRSDNADLRLCCGFRCTVSGSEAGGVAYFLTRFVGAFGPPASGTTLLLSLSQTPSQLRTTNE